MAYDEAFAQRVRTLVAGRRAGPVVEKRMFGGLAFMLAGNMAVVVHGNGRGLMVRVDPAGTETLLAEPGAAVMEMNGRTMRGWLTVAADALAEDDDLRRWINLGLGFAETLPPR